MNYLAHFETFVSTDNIAQYIAEVFSYLILFIYSPIATVMKLVSINKRYFLMENTSQILKNKYGNLCGWTNNTATARKVEHEKATP